MKAELVLNSSDEEWPKLQLYRGRSDYLKFVIFTDNIVSQTFTLSPDDCADLLGFIGTFGAGE